MSKSKIERLERRFFDIYSKNNYKQELGDLSLLTDDELEARMDMVIEKIVLEDMQERPEWYVKQLEVSNVK
jgi:hypothetical protein